MSEVATGSYDSWGNIIFSNGSNCYCYYDNDPTQGSYGVACPVRATSSSVPPLPVNTYPSGGGGVYIQPGGSWLDDALNTILGLSAIENRGSIGAQGVNQNQNHYGGSIYPVGVQPVGGGVGTVAGATVGSFLQNNGFLLLIGVGIFMLYKSGRK